MRREEKRRTKKRKGTNLGLDGLLVLGVPLNDEVKNGLLVLVLEESKHEERQGRVLRLVDLLGDVLDVDLDSSSDLKETEENEGKEEFSLEVRAVKNEQFEDSPRLQPPFPPSALAFQSCRNPRIRRSWRSRREGSHKDPKARS